MGIPLKKPGSLSRVFLGGGSKQRHARVSLAFFVLTQFLEGPERNCENHWPNSARAACFEDHGRWQRGRGGDSSRHGDRDEGVGVCVHYFYVIGRIAVYLAKTGRDGGGLSKRRDSYETRSVSIAFCRETTKRALSHFALSSAFLSGPSAAYATANLGGEIGQCMRKTCNRPPP